MSKTPLYDALLEHRALHPAPFHMPGHKGRTPYEGLEDVWSLDVTELPDTGDLYAGGDAIAQAEALWAESWHMEDCQFLTGGSTQGLLAALLLCARWGRDILVDRACHKSVYHGLAMWNLRPAYLMRRQDEPISPEALEEALDAAPVGRPFTTVCITSPTYYGVLSDVPALAEVAHSRGCELIVDAAHGCHLPFLRDRNPFRGADLVVSSAHKTLPALGQGAVLMGGAGPFLPEELRWAAGVVGTSSPSYPVMASLDLARAFMEGDGGKESYRAAMGQVRAFRDAFPSLRDSVDPLRLTLTVNARVVDGYRVKELLEAMGVFPEMADRDHVVFLFSGMNDARDSARLWRELEEVGRDWPGVWDAPMEPLDPPAPEVVFPPAAALCAMGRARPLAEMEGAVCGETVAPYPPGVPVIAPGERITKKCLAYLREVGYNVHKSVRVMERGILDDRPGLTAPDREAMERARQERELLKREGLL